MNNLNESNPLKIGVKLSKMLYYQGNVRLAKKNMVLRLPS